jgi:hypothetical protein
MSIREKVFSNFKLRVLFRGGELITNYTTKKGGFTPFFAYRISRYQDDFYLYFASEPIAPAYYNEIFNKMACYYGNDSIEFIRFHFEFSANKEAFLDFLFFELKHRSNQLHLPTFFGRRSNARRLSIYQGALEWVNQEIEKSKNRNKSFLYQNYVTNELKLLLRDEVSKQTIPASNFDISAISEKLFPEIDKVLEDINTKAKDKIAEIAGAYSVGKLKFSSDSHLLIFIDLLILLQEYIPKKNDGRTVFDNVTDTDLANILLLHSDFFRKENISISTIRKNYIAERRTILNTSHSGKKDKIERAVSLLFI